MAGVTNSAPREQKAGLGTSLDVLGDRELHHWEERCRDRALLHGATWPHTEAGALVGAILGALVSNDTRPVVAAARAWAGTSSSVSTIVRQMGVLREVLAADDVCAFPDVDDRIVRIMDQATTTATAAALAELEDAALTDALTGVGNRRALETAAMAALSAADRAEHVVSVVVIDLDGLKAINDTDGHAAGDRAIAGITASLRSALRDSDQLFRIGGDEFVALLPMAPIETVTELMARTTEYDAPAFSWGAATAPDDGTDLDTLLGRADMRLYEGRRVTRSANRLTSALERPAVPKAPAAPAATALPAATAVPAIFDAAPAADRAAVAQALRRRRRGRRIQVVAAVIALSALAGVALHFLLKPDTTTPGSRPTAHTTGTGSPATGTPAPGATGAPAQPSGAGGGTVGTRSGAVPGGTGTGTSGTASRTGSGAGSGSGGAANSGTGNPKAGADSTPTITTPAPLLGGTIPTLPNVGPPTTSLP